MNKARTGKFLFLPIALMLAVVSGCDAWAHVKGKVVDESGKPLAGVKAVVKQGESKIDEKETDKTGAIDAGGSICPLPGCAADISITLSKPGYKPLVRRFSGWQEAEAKSKAGLEFVLVAE